MRGPNAGQVPLSPTSVLNYKISSWNPCLVFAFASVLMLLVSRILSKRNKQFPQGETVSTVFRWEILRRLEVLSRRYDVAGELGKCEYKHMAGHVPCI